MHCFLGGMSRLPNGTEVCTHDPLRQRTYNFFPKKYTFSRESIQGKGERVSFDSSKRAYIDLAVSDIWERVTVHPVLQYREGRWRMLAKNNTAPQCNRSSRFLPSSPLLPSLSIKVALACSPSSFAYFGRNLAVGIFVVVVKRLCKLFLKLCQLCCGKVGHSLAFLQFVFYKKKKRDFWYKTNWES